MESKEQGGGYELIVMKRPGYLYLRATGAHTARNVMHFMEEAYAACVANACDSVLLEQSLAGPSIGATDIFGVVRDRLADALKLKRIAYVDTQGRIEGAQFVETVARNRGINLRTFPSIAQAEAWLAEDGSRNT